MCEKVLVTGGTGFIGVYVIAELLRRGFQVRTSVRELRRRDDVLAMLTLAQAPAAGSVEFVEADLTADAGWAGAMAGVDYVLHVASPFFRVRAAEADALMVRPALEGTRRVLSAALDQGVRRVVLTSSFAAVAYGYPETTRRFSETDWTNLDGSGVTPYQRSKTLAERAAWEFAEETGLELAVVNPVAVLGPVLGADYSHSIRVVRAMLAGDHRWVPRTSIGIVDVRDVADLHLRAMVAPEAANQRFIAAAGDPVWLGDVARVLREHLGRDARRVPRWTLPDWVVRTVARVRPARRGLVERLGIVRRPDSTKARQLLGWAPRPIEDTVADTGRSLIDHRLV